MNKIWKELLAGFLTAFTGYRPLLSAWRAGWGGGLPAARKTFVDECRRYWPQSILALLVLLTLLTAILTLGLTLGGVVWWVIRPATL